jgi:Tol biopolymer transport system component
MESGRVVASAGVAMAIHAGITPAGIECGLRAKLRRRKRLLSTVLSIVSIGIVVAWLATQSGLGPVTEFKQRRLTVNDSDNPVTNSVISPDGKYVAYGDQSGVHIKLIDTGEAQTIPPPAQLRAKRVDWSPRAWFPDGTKLLVTATETGGTHASLWAVSILSVRPRVLRDNALAAWVSPDGSRIAFISEPGLFGLAHVLWVMGPNGEEPRKLVDLDANSAFQTVNWAPDGQRIAYMMLHQAPDKLETSIESRRLEGGPSARILSDRRLQDFCWLHDGRVIYSLAEAPPNDTDANFWQIHVKMRTGEPANEPRRLTNWAGFQLRNLTPTVDGKRLSFLKQTIHREVYVGDLQANGMRLTTPRRLTLGEYDNSPTAWTRDSQAVLFWSHRDGRWQILKQALNQESSETLVTVESHTYPRLSADGSWILYYVSPENSGPTTPFNLMRVPVSGGPPQLVLTTHGLPDFHCARSPATQCVLGERSADQRRFVFVSFDPVQGRGRALAEIETDPAGDYGFDLSPSGSRLAFLKRHEDHIRILSLDGSTVGDLHSKGWGALDSLDWAADGKGFFCSSPSPEGATLLHIDLDGNAQALYEQKFNPWNFGIPSPDAKRLAVEGDVFESNVWMIENF